MPELGRKVSHIRSAVFVCLLATTAARAIPPGMTEAERESISTVSVADSSEGGAAGISDALNVTLMSQVTPQQFSTNATCIASSTNVCANDVWAYVSPSGREYAILGLRVGTGFVDVTNPWNPVVVGAISDASSIWSDMKTYGHYAYNVNETGGGMQIIDLSQIDPPTRMVTLVGSLTQSNLQESHTMAVNADSGYAYLCGSNLGGGRLVAVSLANPAAPVIAGQGLEPVYVHAAQVVSYTSGPYAGREIAFCYCGNQGLKILDVTDKGNMFTISTIFYPNTSYCHQGELTEDRRFVLIDDELDEYYGLVATTTTYVVNVENLSSPQFVTSFTNGQPSIDHNQMIRGNFTYQANYTTGLRIYDISNVNNAHEVGYFDTYPFNNGRSFNGAWGVYSRLPSGVVLISDMQGGLFVLNPADAVGANCAAPDAPLAETNPVAKNRYITVVPQNSGQTTALRVTLANLPPPFDTWNGTHRWVDRPEVFADGLNPPTTIKRSRLSCDPVFADWGAEGEIQISDDAIVPNATYLIDAIGGLCASAALPLTTTALWGDMVGSGSLSPDGRVDALDVVGAVNKFKDVPGAPSTSQADLFPGIPDQVINALDITVLVYAFKGFAFPFSGPSNCP